MISYPNLLVGVPTAGDADAVEAASERVRAYCGWHIAPSTTDTVTVEASGNVLILPTLMLDAVFSISDRDGTLVDPATYVVQPNGIVKRDFAWPHWVSVTFRHGYPACPAAVRSVVSHLGSSAVGGGSTVQVGQIRVTSSAASGSSNISDYATILDRYKLPPRL